MAALVGSISAGGRRRRIGAVAFTGWSNEAIDFYDGLEEDNSRSYWQAHKSVYDSAVKAPMEALLADLADEFGEGRIFRPNRDVRFSADKSPYKTSIAATLAEGGYVQLSAAGLGVGNGMYMMASDQLERFRSAIDADATGQALVDLVEATRSKGLEVTAHESLKTAPRGYARDHPRIDLLRQKGLIVWKEWPVGAWLATKGAETRVVDVLRGSKPIVGWLDEHVGPSTLETSWR
jgi:uncharacterized protein (TIGR02453 family)